MCEISLNVEETFYIDHIKNLIKTVFRFEPSIKAKRRDNTTVIGLYRKGFIEFLIKLGLHSGNKVKNQVGIPTWIFNNSVLLNSKDLNLKDLIQRIQIACLRGLFDTDGTIYLTLYPKKNYMCVGIKFTNASKNLVQDFKSIVESLGIKMSKISIFTGKTKNGTNYVNYNIGTQSKYFVNKFIFEIIKPIKWQYIKLKIQDQLAKFDIKIEEILKYKRKRRIN
ncbi:MAG: LAGLIDADG family homing endonuclease [Candidatus Hermodarchaeota archaeon]